jgi:glucose-1-phosphate cytidylyltransferase
MKAVILAGGLGTRLAEETSVRPKPMVEIGGKPMLWHIMNIFAAGGVKEFCVACGYKGEQIKEYFGNFHLHHADLSVDMRNGSVDLHNNTAPDWLVHLVDTGMDTMTGGRIKRLAHVIGDDTFMMTYGDGVADIDVRALIEFHKSHGKLATLTAVRPPSRFGGLEFAGDQVVNFIEKPQLGEGWINGGFMVLEPEVFDFIAGDQIIFEREPLERLCRDGQLMAFRHEGFWQPMDTLREKQLLEELWRSGNAPWKIWHA